MIVDHQAGAAVGAGQTSDDVGPVGHGFIFLDGHAHDFEFARHQKGDGFFLAGGNVRVQGVGRIGLSRADKLRRQFLPGGLGDPREHAGF